MAAGRLELLKPDAITNELLNKTKNILSDNVSQANDKMQSHSRHECLITSKKVVYMYFYLH